MDASIYTISRHEIAGEVTKVGRSVTKFKVGDKVGVGCFVHTCGTCDSCKEDQENYCPNLQWIFNGKFPDGSRSFGGYSDRLVINERYAVLFPDNFPLDAAAPLMCAGITVYSPMTYFGLAEAGKHMGVVGLGGLGHLAVKFAKAFGMKVTVISTSPSKRQEAVERLGADAFLESQDQDQLQVSE